MIGIVCALVLAIAVPTGLGTKIGLVKTTEAAVKLNITKKTLAVGQTAKLKVKGTGKSVKWKTSNKAIVSVSSNGKIRAKKKGKATITAKVGKKTLKCVVTVKKNAMKFSGGQVARQTGFYDIGQNGDLKASINIMPVSMSYTKKGALKIKFMLWNFSSYNWTRISKLRGVYIATDTGKVLVNMDPVNLTNAFSIAPDETKYLTLTFSGKNVKRVVNLNKTGGISYAIDIYLNDAWYK